MFGNNPIRPPVKGDGEFLEIQHIFSTFQGEGPFAGWPAIFIRLGGCNLACAFCDTEFETFTSMTLEAILEKAVKLATKGEKRTHNLVVITGGEPFRQPITLLCERLLSLGFDVQIETNGTLYRPIDARVHIICSPKMSNGKYHLVREDLLPHITAFKFIISSFIIGYDDAAGLGQARYNIPVYVQPMDEYCIEKNKHNLEKAVNLAQEKGYRVSLQMHKIAGVE